MNRMNKKALIVAVLIILVAVIAIIKFVLLRTPNTAGLKVNSNPVANIFIDDKLLGKSPFEQKYTAGDYVLKLIPQDSTGQVTSWQGKVKLNPSVYTYINRDLGPSELVSGGEILTLEKLTRNDIQLNVLSIPDAATVLVDGLERGVTPLLLEDLSEGEHDIAISAVGFISRTVRVQLTQSYKLTANIQLALSKTEEIIPTGVISTPSSIDDTKTSNQSIVTIKDTETGFLRVRSGPSKTATETAQVKPGDKYSLIEEKDGWVKISISNGKEGWVSGLYVEK